MKKPYIICHMACSIDGKIVYDNWGNNVPKKAYTQLYNECHESFKSQAWLLGRVSLEQDFSKGIKPELIPPGSPILREPFIGNKQAVTFAIAIDTKGKLGWKSNEIEGDHIIVVLTEQISDEYLYYLQRKNISYIFAGEKELNLKLALEQVTKLFPVSVIMLEGGGHLNGSLLNEGLIDELSILILPIADGTPNTPTVFEVNNRIQKKSAALLYLENVKRLKNDVLWLRYKVNQ